MYPAAGCARRRQGMRASCGSSFSVGSAEPIEGWALVHGASHGFAKAMLERWEPSNALPSASIGGVGAQGGQTKRYWVMPAEGTPVRERPWGKVLCTKSRGVLLRCDCERDGWVRLEGDFTEEGPLDTCVARERDGLE